MIIDFCEYKKSKVTASCEEKLHYIYSKEVNDVRFQLGNDYSYRILNDSDENSVFTLLVYPKGTTSYGAIAAVRKMVDGCYRCNGLLSNSSMRHHHWGDCLCWLRGEVVGQDFHLK
jgi:hypothetical protein